MELVSLCIEEINFSIDRYVPKFRYLVMLNYKVFYMTAINLGNCKEVTLPMRLGSPNSILHSHF